MPAFVRPLHVKLHEGARQIFIFPRGGRLAGAQAHNRIVHPKRLAGLQRQVAHDSVALVEEPEDGNAVGHGGDARLLARAGIGARQGRTIGLLRPIVAPATCKKQQRRAGYGKTSHAQSGCQG